MPRKTIKRKREVWGESGSDEHGLTVAAEERREQPGTVRLKFWISARKTYEWVPLPSICIRNGDGTINRQQVNVVRTLLAAAVLARSEGASVALVALLIRDLLGKVRLDQAKSEGAVTGEGDQATPTAIAVGAAASVNDSAIAPADAKSVPPANAHELPPTAATITLGDALDLYFAIKTGKFRQKSKQRGNEIGYAHDVVGSVSRNRLVDSIDPLFFDELWTAFAARYKSIEIRKFYPGKRRGFDPQKHVEPGTLPPRVVLLRWGGPIHCEKTTEFLIRFFSWLVSKRLKREKTEPGDNWKSTLREQWKEITGESVRLAVDEDGPRHDEVQMSSIYTTKTDPRLDLAIDLGFEARLGQVIRTCRSAFQPSKGPHGYLKTFSGDKRKRGVGMYLTAEQRARLDYEMSKGYLRDLEKAFLDGRIKDYPLFPGGRFTPYTDFSKQMEPLTSGGLRKMFNKLEKDANVPHEKGRGWYGLRRGGADLSQEVAEATVEDFRFAQQHELQRDEVALNSITGHKNTRSRERYLLKENASAMLRATHIRGNTRRRLADGTRIPKSSESDQ
jgi:hypothetical protein